MCEKCFTYIDAIKRNDDDDWNTPLWTNHDGTCYKRKSRAFPKQLDRLKCRCGSLNFEILSVPGEYETIGRCNTCGYYYTVHTG